MTRHFDNFDQYSEHYNEHEHRANDVDIVEYDGAKKPHTDADGEFTCKNRQTAIKRFAKATGWEWVLIEAECPVFAKNLSTDCDGENALNSRETWLDVQACALSQAARLVCEAVGEVIA